MTRIKQMNQSKSRPIKLFTAMAMYIRFVTTRIDEYSHKPQGLFMACGGLLHEGDLSDYEREQIREVIDWFNDNLPGPGRSFNPCRAIFWFKQTANKQINRMWDLANLLRLHGFYIELQKCEHLANIIFEDKLQVAAYPSARDGRYIRG